MSSHVVVIASTARRATVKVTPNTHLSDVLQEACGKLGFDASQYGLKNNKKLVDLSRTIRLSGLSSGAKLELVQLSKSAGVVSIALQLPESEAQGVPNARLTDKFPSNTTLWLLLRKFEAGVAGGNTVSKRNLTARGAPSLQAGNSGTGRLFYETPVIQVMGRELSSFTDLQKTLAQLGFNSGSTLLRLTFRISQTPLEEAMAQIEEYFKSVDPPSAEASAVSPSIVAETTSESLLQPAEPMDTTPDPTTNSETQPLSSTEIETLQPTVVQSASSPDPEPTTTTSSGRPLSIFLPPKSSTPSAALTTHNPADYTPTIEHAKVHQRMLSASTRNVRLPTEAQLATQQAEEAEKLAAIKDVEIKIRMPDQSAISARFGQGDTSADLYGFVRECLEDAFKGEAFLLRELGLGEKEGMVREDSTKRLIKDLAMKGRVLLVFGWDDTKASVEARSAKSILQKELRGQAKEVVVPNVVAVQGEEPEQGLKVNVGKTTGDEGDGKKKTGGVPKWLKGLSKK